MHPGALSVAPLAHFAKADVAPHETRTAQAAPVTSAAPVTAAAAVAQVPAAAPMPAVAQIEAMPIAPISFDTTASVPHLEFAALLLGDN
jgi:hypothetical protein